MTDTTTRQRPIRNPRLTLYREGPFPGDPLPPQERPSYLRVNVAVALLVTVLLAIYLGATGQPQAVHRVRADAVTQPIAQSIISPRMGPGVTSFVGPSGHLVQEVNYAAYSDPTLDPCAFDPQCALQYWANEYQISYSLASCIAQHESGFDNSAVGDGGEAIGFLQFHQATYDGLQAQLNSSTLLPGDRPELRPLWIPGAAAHVALWSWWHDPATLHYWTTYDAYCS